MHLKGAYWHNMLAHTPDYDTTHTLSVFFKHTHTHSLLVCVWVWARALCQVSAQRGTPLHVSTRWTHLCLLHTHTHSVTTPWTSGLQHKDTNMHTFSFFLSQMAFKKICIFIPTQTLDASQEQMVDMLPKKQSQETSLILYTIHFNC